MSSGSFGSYPIEPIDFKIIRDIAVRVLESEDYQVHRRKAAKREVKVEGIRGSKLMAVLTSAIPIINLLGYGSRVQATVICRESLSKSEKSYRLTIRVIPIQELDSAPEERYHSQSREERIGDNAQAKRCFKKLLEAFEAKNIIRDDGYTKHHK